MGHCSYHIPEVRLGRLPVHTEDDEWDVLLIFINHSKHEMKIQIRDIIEWNPEEKTKEFQVHKKSCGLFWGICSSIWNFVVIHVPVAEGKGIREGRGWIACVACAFGFGTKKEI